jgi:hypothetical protein
MVTPLASGLGSRGDTMEVTRCNLKAIMKGSGGYHEKRWNVVFSLAANTIDSTITGYRTSCAGWPIPWNLPEEPWRIARYLMHRDKILQRRSRYRQSASASSQARKA